MNRHEATGSPSAIDDGLPVLELQNVEKHYGSSVAVKSVSLSVQSGELLTLLGPSGSGKTTLLKLVAGFTDITGGRIMLRGRDISELSPAERGIGMVFQNYALFPHMTVADNVAYGLKMLKRPSAVREQRVAEMLELVGLPQFGGRLPRELSGGQQQRVALARALAFGPSLLLMDEPLGALDRELRERMMVEIRRIHQEVGVTALYVTHDREEALTLSDRIAIMRDGVLEGAGTPADLLTIPPSRFIATFFGDHPVIPGRLVSLESAGTGDARAMVKCLGQSLCLTRVAPGVVADSDVGVVVPAAAMSAERPDDMSKCLQLDAVVAESLDLGDHVRLTCELPGTVSSSGTPHRLRITDDRSGALGGQLKPGDPLQLFASTPV
ncbi:MAG TPA: ABC transporter ATP-binding protein, partial [Mycobacteriales bacterium]|nr:ABC transporter ATP-binding protein [Mycobacteriales bacterium]